MAITKYPFANIKSLLSKDVTVILADGTEHVIPKGVSSVANEATIKYESTDIGAWKIDASAADLNYVAVKKRVVGNTGRKSTVNLPEKADGIIYLVNAEVAAVGRKIEGREDLLTPADLIRARNVDTKGYYTFTA